MLLSALFLLVVACCLGRMLYIPGILIGLFLGFRCAAYIRSLLYFMLLFPRVAGVLHPLVDEYICRF